MAPFRGGVPKFAILCLIPYRYCTLKLVKTDILIIIINLWISFYKYEYSGGGAVGWSVPLASGKGWVFESQPRQTKS